MNGTPVLVTGMNAVRFQLLPEYGIMVAATKSFGESYLVTLEDVVRRRLTPLNEDTKAIKATGLTGVAKAPLTPPGLKTRGANVDSMVGFFYPNDDESTIKRAMVDIACAILEDKIGQLLNGFNEQRQFIYECFPHLTGDIKSYEDIRDRVTGEQKAHCVRTFLEQQPLAAVVQYSQVPRDNITGVSRDMITGNRKPEQEFPGLQAVNVVARNGKFVGLGYLSVATETKCGKMSNVWVYYPDDNSPYYVVIADTGRSGASRFDTSVLETLDETVAAAQEGLEAPIASFSCAREQITSKQPVPAFTKVIGTCEMNVGNANDTLEDLKTRCKKAGIPGYSNKDKDQLMEMLAEYWTEKTSEAESPLKGNYIVKRESVGRHDKHSPEVPGVIGRVSAGKVFLSGRESVVDESKLNTRVQLIDVLNPFEPGFKHVNADRDTNAVVKEVFGGAK